MINTPVLENHYNVNVWTNHEMDELRKTECLCLNCKYLGCQDSKMLYEICKQSNIALAVTRCPYWGNKS